MKDFIFPRSFSNSKWNINNPNDVDSDGKSVALAVRISEDLPGLVFKLKLTPEECLVSFENDLTAQQQTDLNNTVNAHIGANGIINPQDQIILTDPNGVRWGVRVNILGIVTTTQL